MDQGKVKDVRKWKSSRTGGLHAGAVPVIPSGVTIRLALGANAGVMRGVASVSAAVAAKSKAYGEREKGKERVRSRRMDADRKREKERESERRRRIVDT